MDAIDKNTILQIQMDTKKIQRQIRKTLYIDTDKQQRQAQYVPVDKQFYYQNPKQVTGIIDLILNNSIYMQSASDDQHYLFMLFKCNWCCSQLSTYQARKFFDAFLLNTVQEPRAGQKRHCLIQKSCHLSRYRLICTIWCRLLQFLKIVRFLLLFTFMQNLPVSCSIHYC